MQNECTGIQPLHSASKYIWNIFWPTILACFPIYCVGCSLIIVTFQITPNSWICRVDDCQSCGPIRPPPCKLQLHDKHTEYLQSTSQAIHLFIFSFAIKRGLGDLRSRKKHSSLTSHCRSLLESFPPDSSITLWIPSSSFSAFATSSLESFSLQEKHECAKIHTAAKLHQVRKETFVFGAYII